MRQVANWWDNWSDYLVHGAEVAGGVALEAVPGVGQVIGTGLIGAGAVGLANDVGNSVKLGASSSSSSAPATATTSSTGLSPSSISAARSTSDAAILGSYAATAAASNPYTYSAYDANGMPAKGAHITGYNPQLLAESQSESTLLQNQAAAAFSGQDQRLQGSLNSAGIGGGEAAANRAALRGSQAQQLSGIESNTFSQNLATAKGQYAQDVNAYNNAQIGLANGDTSLGLNLYEIGQSNSNYQMANQTNQQNAWIQGGATLLGAGATAAATYYSNHPGSSSSAASTASIASTASTVSTAAVQPASTAPVTSAPVTSAPVNPAPVNPAPVNPAPVDQSLSGYDTIPSSPFDSYQPVMPWYSR